MIRVGVFGAGGRMGATVCGAVMADPELELVAAVDPYHAGDRSPTARCRRRRGAGGADGFCAPRCGRRRRRRLHGAGRRARQPRVVCRQRRPRSGGHHRVLRRRPCRTSPTSFEASVANAVIAPNFAIGAVLMMKFAELAAPYFDSAEIIELHHERRSTPRPEPRCSPPRAWPTPLTRGPPIPPQTWVLDSAPGRRGPGGIRVHSVRLRGLVAHQEVILGTTGPVADDSPRLVRPFVVHARRAARDPGRAREGGPHGRARHAARAVSAPDPRGGRRQLASAV